MTDRRGSLQTRFWSDGRFARRYELSGSHGHGDQRHDDHGLAHSEGQARFIGAHALNRFAATLIQAMVAKFQGWRLSRKLTVRRSDDQSKTRPEIKKQCKNDLLNEKRRIYGLPFFQPNLTEA